MAYLLNEGQAVYITAKSNTKTAAEITVQMVRVFNAWRRGELPPAPAAKQRSHVEIEPITADEIADAEAIPRLGETVLARALHSNAWQPNARTAPAGGLLPPPVIRCIVELVPENTRGGPCQGLVTAIAIGVCCGLPAEVTPKV